VVPRNIKSLAEVLELERDWAARLAVAESMRPEPRARAAVESARRELELAREAVRLNGAQPLGSGVGPTGR
jgi:hypothetical protein